MIYFNSEESPCAEEDEIKIDVEALAQKVYELLKQDLRLTQERLGREAYGIKK